MLTTKERKCFCKCKKTFSKGNSASSALQCWVLCHLYFRCRRVRWCMHRTCSPGNRRDPSIKHRKECINCFGPSICVTTKNCQNIPSYPHQSRISAAKFSFSPEHQWCVFLSGSLCYQGTRPVRYGSLCMENQWKNQIINKAQIMHKSCDKMWMYKNDQKWMMWCILMHSNAFNSWFLMIPTIHP